MFKLPDGLGLELLEELRPLHPRLPMLVLSRSVLFGEQFRLVDAALGKSPMGTQHLLTIRARRLPAKRRLPTKRLLPTKESSNA